MTTNKVLATQEALTTQAVLANKIYTKQFKEQLTDIVELNEDAREFMNSVINGVHRAAIVYGEAGMGKTHIVTSSLNEHGLTEGVDYVVLRSHTTPLMLYVWLYLMRDEGKFIVLDDCDGIIANENGLNLLKSAADNSFRQVGWATTQLLFNPIDKKPIPNTFEFNGRIIITTNIRLAAGRGRIANHMDAIRSRFVPCSLNLTSKEEQYAQIFYMVVEKDYLATQVDTDITNNEKLELLEFILKNKNVARRLDLRLPQIIAREIKNKKANWERRALRLLEAA